MTDNTQSEQLVDEAAGILGICPLGALSFDTGDLVIEYLNLAVICAFLS
jgi:hypothetical protein